MRRERSSSGTRVSGSFRLQDGSGQVIRALGLPISPDLVLAMVRLPGEAGSPALSVYRQPSCPPWGLLEMQKLGRRGLTSL